MSEAEFVGKQIPFYESKDIKNDNDNNKKNLFNPKINFSSKFKRSPSWSFQNKNPMKIPNEQMDEKDLMIDVMRSYDLIKKRGIFLFTIRKPFDYSKTEQYKLNKENHPEFSLGPTHYWKSK